MCVLIFCSYQNDTTLIFFVRCSIKKMWKKCQPTKYYVMLCSFFYDLSNIISISFHSFFYDRKISHSMFDNLLVWLENIFFVFHASYFCKLLKFVTKMIARFIFYFIEWQQSVPCEQTTTHFKFFICLKTNFFF